MAAAWVKISTILCLCYTAEMKGVFWKEVGDYITIQCRIQSDQGRLDLKMGINEDTTIIGIDKSSNKEIILNGMAGRVQTHGEFPNKDILIKNLKKNDTGPYWCVYSIIDDKTYYQNVTKGEGSLLLVVTEKWQAIPPTSTESLTKCEEQQSLNMVVVYIVIAVAALLIIMLGFIGLVMHKTKISDNTVKPRRIVTSNDVYEDMRGTLRR